MKRIMRLLNNNRGLTLLELIITFALLGIVSLAITGLLSTGANSYRRVSTEVSLQYESQLAMNQLQEYLIDSNGGVYFDGDILYVADADGESEGAPLWFIHCFYWNADSAELYYWKGTVTYDEHNQPQCTPPAFDSSEWALMASYVGTFHAEPGTFTDSSKQFCRIVLTMSLGGRTYTAEETVALRNPVKTSTSDYQSWLTLVCG